jgi:glycolate oxidase iron-sulfur subunit
MRAVVEGRLDPGSGAFQTHIDRCLGCRACETVCPSGVEYGSLLERARAEAARARSPSLLTRALLAVFGSRTAMRVAMVLSLAFRLTGLPSLGVRLLPNVRPFRRVRFALAMLAASEPWKRPSGGPPSGDRAQGVPAAQPDTRARDAAPPRVALLRGCVQRWLFAPVNLATVRVLETNGCKVDLTEGQGCCGALHAHGGDLETARALARRNVDVFSAARVDFIAVNAAGCGAVMREYGHLLAGDPAYAERAREISSRVRDASELLAARGPLPGAPVPVSATYDAPCHLQHAQRVTAPPRAVLGAIPGLDLRPLQGEDECCGGAGIYGLTHGELGERIGRDKAEAVERTGADVVVTANPGCAMQIGAWLRLSGSSTRVVHLIEMLDESYRRAGYYP